jgi:hypothetical protein
MTLLEKLKALLTESEEAVFVEPDADDTFSVADGSEGRKQWSGLLFRAGDYGPKGKYGPDELRRFVDGFPAQGVPILDTHKGSFIGKCMEADKARLVKVWTNPEGTELHGTKDVPSWLDRAARTQTKRVSIGLTDDRSGLKEVSLCLNPHVADAAVFDHDGAAMFASSPNFSAFAAAHPDDARLVTEAAKAPVPPEPMPLTKEQKIDEAKKAYPNLPQFMRDRQTEAEFVTFSIGESPTTQTQAEKDQEARLKALETQSAQQQAQFSAKQDEWDAKEFYGEQLAQSKATPVDRESVIAEFSLRREFDRMKNAGPTFSANAEGSKEAEFRKAYEDKKPVFALGPTRISMKEDLNLGNDGLGIFSNDFKEDTK